MYPKFIELHDKDSGTRFSVNVEHVVVVGEKGIILALPSDVMKLETVESYEEIKTIITDSGCLIKKADPRIDTEHRLTLEDLRGMIGEPVWQGNLNAWLLVVSCDDQYATLRWSSGNVSTSDENDLLSYPLYRMKKDVAGSKRRGEDDDTTG